jgi:hypothetical protein
MPTIDLTDDEHAAVTALIKRAIEQDRFPLAPRLNPLRSASGGRWRPKATSPASRSPQPQKAAHRSASGRDDVAVLLPERDYICGPHRHNRQAHADCRRRAERRATKPFDEHDAPPLRYPPRPIILTLVTPGIV